MSIKLIILRPVVLTLIYPAFPNKTFQFQSTPLLQQFVKSRVFPIINSWYNSFLVFNLLVCVPWQSLVYSYTCVEIRGECMVY